MTGVIGIIHVMAVLTSMSPVGREGGAQHIVFPRVKSSKWLQERKEFSENKAKHYGKVR